MYDFPTDLDDATKLILEEIGKMGMKIRNEEGQEIKITPEDFIRFWKQVGNFTSSSPSGIHYSHYKGSTKYNKVACTLKDGKFHFKCSWRKFLGCVWSKN